jgi:hypothetical protein
MKYVNDFTTFLNESKIENKLKEIDVKKFEYGYGFIFNVKGKRYAFLAYNEDGKQHNSPGEVLNLNLLKNLQDRDIPIEVILHIEAYFLEKARRVTKLEFADKKIDTVIIVGHNLNFVEIFTK